MTTSNTPSPLKILVDADAIPNVLKEILFRLANRTQIEVIFVANSWIKTPPSRYIKSLQVSHGFDMADDKIVSLASKNDLVITADIPLAAEVLAKGAFALNPRGDFYDKGTIKAKLTMRDFNETLRSSGIQTKGPEPLNQRDRQNFSNALDRWVRDNK